jgi:hypothetical protein
MKVRTIFLNSGLYIYEKTISNHQSALQHEKIIVKPNPESTSSATQNNATPKNPKIGNACQPINVSSPQRFVTGGLTAASPPVGWLVNNNVPSSLPRNSGIYKAFANLYITNNRWIF